MNKVEEARDRTASSGAFDGELREKQGAPHEYEAKIEAGRNTGNMEKRGEDDRQDDWQEKMDREDPKDKEMPDIESWTEELDKSVGNTRIDRTETSKNRGAGQDQDMERPRLGAMASELWRKIKCLTKKE